MEIPESIKKLYKHWEYHTKVPALEEKVLMNEELLQKIELLITERQKIWERRESGMLPPWTKNEILRDYRFCNVYRELDRQTIEFHTLFQPLLNNFPLWLLNMSFGRFVCNPELIKKVGFLSFDEENNREVFARLSKLPSPKYGAAYIFPVSIIMKSQFPTREEFFCFYLPKVMSKCATVIESFEKEPVASALKRILPVFGFNFIFHWTEILIDVAYQFPQYIDLFREFPSGPGSISILKQISSKIEQEKLTSALTKIQPANFPFLEYNGKEIYLSAENWEGICCEYRKYSNLLAGKGRKRKFFQPEI